MPGVIERGVVSAVAEGGVDVRIDSSPSAGCKTCGHCGVGEGGTMLMSGVADSLGVRLGDTVEVELPEGARLRTSALAYGLPVLGLVVGYLAGFLLGSGVGVDPDGTGALVAAATAVGTFVLARRWCVETIGRERFRPRVRAIISPSGQQMEVDRPQGGSNR